MRLPCGDLTRGQGGDEDREREPARGEACRRPPGPHLAIAQRPAGEEQHDGHQHAVLAAQHVRHAERDAECKAVPQPGLAPEALDRRQRREDAGQRRQRQHVEVRVHRRQHHQHGATRQRDRPRPTQALQQPAARQPGGHKTGEEHHVVGRHQRAAGEGHRRRGDPLQRHRLRQRERIGRRVEDRGVPIASEEMGQPVEVPAQLPQAEERHRWGAVATERHRVRQAQREWPGGRDRQRAEHGGLDEHPAQHRGGRPGRRCQAHPAQGEHVSSISFHFGDEGGRTRPSSQPSAQRAQVRRA